MMKKYLLPLLALLLVATISNVVQAENWRRGERLAQHYQGTRAWHGPYYQEEWGAPLPLVVPPTARMSTSWSWGVAQSEVRPIYHQFQRNYPGQYESHGGAQQGFQPTPQWPSHTDQFGVYYIRSPW
ncbi:MAG: hypothetical protein ACI9HK_004606 [Pirellulaceae bacterium]|jgi:hypothetical protein